MSGADLRRVRLLEWQRPGRRRLPHVHVQSARELPSWDDGRELPGRHLRRLWRRLRARRQELSDMHLPRGGDVRATERPLQELPLRLAHGAERLSDLLLRGPASGMRADLDDLDDLSSRAPARQAPSSIMRSMARAAPTRTSSGTVMRWSGGSSRNVV
jgi:hypothetical protein